jgi:hypothetical protein
MVRQGQLLTAACCRESKSGVAVSTSQQEWICHLSTKAGLRTLVWVGASHFSLDRASLPAVAYR